MSIRQKYPNFYQPHESVVLGHAIPSNSSKIFKHTVVPGTKRRTDVSKFQQSDCDIENANENDEPNTRFIKNQWQNSEVIVFCNESTMHGLKFIVQRKIHFTERLFWILAFLLSFATALFLIYEVWDRQSKVPVLVSFQAKAQRINSLPFPAVTLCSMNRFPKSKVLQLEREAGDPENPNKLKAKKRLSYVRAACNAHPSFAKTYNYAYRRGTQPGTGTNDSLADYEQTEMIDYLLENTMGCGEFIRLCKFQELDMDCDGLFKPIITDAGKCCTFNILPLPLLFKNQTQNGSEPHNIFLGTKQHWDRQELKQWGRWNYNKGYRVHDVKFMHGPWMQTRAGINHGLSLLIDPNIDDFYCPVSDSMGIRYVLHSPLEIPHVSEFASVADLGKEVLVKVHPDVTNADEDIKDIEQKKRQCWFGDEKKDSLKYYRPYTTGNCIDNCNAKWLQRYCNCTFSYMPRYDGERICNDDLNSADYMCTSDKLVDLKNVGYDQFCDSCDPLCDNIEYNYESTSAELQSGESLWGDPDPKHHPSGKPNWANHKMSIVHIFFASDTTVPKLRKRLYGITDLIANTGGILGLCLGFSILSGVEVIYYVTLRAFWKYCRKRTERRRRRNSSEQTGVTPYKPNMIRVKAME